jgi:hypothetical protein
MLPIGTKKDPVLPSLFMDGSNSGDPAMNKPYANKAFGGSARSATPLTFPDILCDPLVRLVMAADRVDPRALKAELHQVATGLGLAPAETACGC